MSQPSVTCLCKKISFPLSVKLPATTELCHCNPCRQTSGALFLGFVRIPKPSLSTLELCTAYASTVGVDRYFCSTCGTNLFFNNKEAGTWSLASGTVDPPDGKMDNVIDIGTHEFVADTIDGGFTPFLQVLNGVSIPAYEEDATSRLLSADALRDLAATSRQSVDRPKGELQIKCHCGGVDFWIQRPNYPPDSKDKYVAADKTKFVASVCVCRYCRLHTGSAMAPVLFCLWKDIINPHTRQPINPRSPSDNGTARGQQLKHYWSSSDSCRSFCGSCGAAVFYWCEDLPDLVDVFVGTVRADEGAMARQWLAWRWGHASWEHGATDKQILAAWKQVEGDI